MSYGGYNDYQTTTYGGGGTGFLAGSQSASQASPSKDRSKHTIRPVTIKQIIDATTPHDDTTFFVDNHEIHQITFVAQIRSVSKVTTNVMYKMEDGTGSVEVRQFIQDNRTTGEFDDEASNEPEHDPALVEDAYVRVVGGLKQFNGKRHVAIHRIRAIEDFNEIQYHLLDATAIHLYYTRGPPGIQQGQNNDAIGDTAMGGAGDTSGSRANLLPPGISPNARKIYAILKSRPDSSEGMHVSLIGQTAKLPLAETYKAVDELLTNGVCFTTMDDEHIACMDF
ncbi:hypothetical protein ABW19_dt0207302 [Dactylella cylindrospora]|nr:hypothetical protein ABW19_dt0207302 [Dactylella cylindrospora]